MTIKKKTKYLTAEQAGAKPERLMGPHGPLRMFSATKFASSIYYESRDWNGFAGSYVCDQCLQPEGAGVYRVDDKWLCGGCKEAIRKANKRSRKASLVLQ